MIYTSTSPRHDCRAAVVVGKHGRTIVERNHLRRRLRELIRVSVLPVCKGTDFIVYALPAAYHADFSTLDLEIRELALDLSSGMDR